MSYNFLLLLRRFSRVGLLTAAHQAPPSLGFSRQEHWSGLPFPSSMRESEVAQSCPTLCDPMDCSLPGSSIRGIFQARVLIKGKVGKGEEPLFLSRVDITFPSSVPPPVRTRKLSCWPGQDTLESIFRSQYKMRVFHFEKSPFCK